MVKLLRSVVRLSGLVWAERLRLAEFVKVDILRVLVEVDVFHRNIYDIEREQGKRTVEECYKVL